MERGAEGWKLGERVAAGVTGKTHVGEASWEMCLRSTKYQIFEMRARGGDATISVSVSQEGRLRTTFTLRCKVVRLLMDKSGRQLGNNW